MPESASDIAAVLQRLERLEVELAAARAEIARKDQVIAALQQRLFGSKSERLDPAQLSLMFEEALLGKAEPLSDQAGGSEEAPAEARAKRTRRTKAELYPRNLRIEIVGELVPEEVQADPEAFREIDAENHDELEVKRGELYWRRVVRRKFVSVTDRTQPPLMEPAPLPTVPGTLIGAGLAAQIVADKYVDHLPHYRQSARFERCHRAQLSRQTINQWTHAVAAHLTPIGEAIKAELTEAAVLQIDESERSGDRLPSGSPKGERSESNADRLPESRSWPDQDRILLGLPGPGTRDGLLRLAVEPGA
ncbi:MAG: transposase [Verrucomicrobiae bacterium]|nr:transposase [Verrucomicrobiae bacterium]